MWVWLKLQLTPQGRFLCIFFVNFLTHITKRYLNGHSKYSNFTSQQFTPESETASTPFTFIWESLPWDPRRKLDVEELRRENIIAQGYDRENRKRGQVR